MNPLFTHVPIPRHHLRNAVAHRGLWYSWSPSSKRLIEANIDRILALPRPPCISVHGCDPYSASYSYRLSALPETLSRLALDIGGALLRVRAGSGMRFFAGMLDPPFSSPVFHKCLALMRAAVVRLKGDARSALHAPVKTERVDNGFPLHADLFLTEQLWLVFDDVPVGPSGKALFLPRVAFEAAIKSNPLIPSGTRQRLRTLMNGRSGGDSFDEFFDLIYSPKRSWTAALAKAMKKSCWAIKFRQGEGYLLNDRQFLHGRTPVTGRVSSARFRRLIYGSVRDHDASSRRM